ncbi:unnamed protein product [Callosobruchus maculatus]|uniref:Acyl-CoA-binding domain-containing protein 6 n=1 Tax=Callosobruchus maculatus TaxID=64391 RepID=A0A653DIY2_CALMS|nr:unnamed protein product [Callosobruchus maculatus]
MAEFVDDFSDLEELGIDIHEKQDPLTQAFIKAADHMQKLVSQLDNDTLLKQYALYKQATEGPCTIPQPSWFDRKGRAKWDAWHKLEQMPKDEAKRLYIDGIRSVDPQFSHDSGDKGWVKVSAHERPKTPEVQTAIDHVKRCNVDALAEFLEKNPHEVHQLDEEGLGLVHWAADSGHKPVLEILLRTGVNLDLRDSEGQTALHYAASCGHVECVEFLLEAGSKVDAADHEGNLPIHVADDTVRGLLEKS